MWIPYDLRGLLVAEPRGAAAKAAEADQSLRPFIVGIWLKNPVTQHWETDLNLPEGMKALVCAGPHGPAEIGFHANDAGRLSEVIARFEARSARGAVEIALSLLQPRLLALSARLGRGITVAAWQVMDLQHGQRFRASPNRPSTLDTQAAWFLTPPPADLLPALMLCQRSRSAAEPAGRLLAATSALAHMQQSGVFNAPALAGLQVTPQMLLLAATLGHCEDLLGISFSELLSKLRPVVAELVQPDGLWAAVPPEAAGTPRLSALANLADLAAHRMIAARLRAEDQPRQAVAETVG